MRESSSSNVAAVVSATAKYNNGQVIWRETVLWGKRPILDDRQIELRQIVKQVIGTTDFEFARRRYAGAHAD